MLKLFSIFNTDSINKHDIRFTVSALNKSIIQTYEKGIPSCLGHDIHSPVAWVQPLGLFIDSKMAKSVGLIWVPELEKEREELFKTYKYYLYKMNEEECLPYKEKFLSLLNEINLSAEKELIVAGCVAVWDKNIVGKVFPEIIKEMEKDEKQNLIEINFILKKFDYLGEGIFKDKKSEFTIFVHEYFRQSLSRFNNYNLYFINNLMDLKENSELNIKIAIDTSLLGYAPSFKRTFEFEYWYGPKFDNDILSIPSGVTAHQITDKFQLSLYGISSTEFWWKKNTEEQKHELEIEELKDKPSFGISEDSYGCRYVHSIFNYENGSFEHFDGAIRMYDTDKICSRMEKPINKSGKDTEYKKIFRIDGNLPISKWKSLVSYYFYGNPLVREYFCNEGQTEANEAHIIEEEKNSVLDDLVPYSINKDDGLKLFISYQHIERFEKYNNNERSFIERDFYRPYDKNIYFFENEVIELKKSLRKLGADIEIPKDILFLFHQDDYFNFPQVHHGNKSFPNNIKTTLLAYKNLFEKMNNVFISFSFSWIIENKVVCISLLGHVEHLKSWFNKFVNDFPLSNDEQINDWLEKYSEWSYKNFTQKSDYHLPIISQITQSSGVLLIKREIINKPDKLKLIRGENNNINYQYLITKGEEELWEALKENKIQISMGNIIDSSECSKCKKNYLKCKHSKILDSNVTQIITKTSATFPFWTDKHSMFRNSII